MKKKKERWEPLKHRILKRHLMAQKYEKCLSQNAIVAGVLVILFGFDVYIAVISM